MGKVTCTRNGCGKQFDPDADPVECIYHPGAPIFHEGLKGWSCCKTNFTDFSDFLNHPGCAMTMGCDATPKRKTTNVGRPDKPKDGEVDTSGDVAQPAAPPVDDGLGSHHIDRAIPLERPKESAKVLLKVIETASAKKAFGRAQKAHLERAAVAAEESAGTGAATQEIDVGAPCLHNACGMRYVDESSLAPGVCQYHPGIPVFHEGLKYWSCDERKKFTEFEDCMNHRGCTTGDCKFIPTAEDIAKANKTKCRYDYVQSGNSVTITIYAKAVDPEKLVVKTSVTDLEMSLIYKFTSSFELNMALSGCVKPEESEVTIYGSKVEVCLKKADGCSWEQLGTELAALSTDDK